MTTASQWDIQKALSWKTEESYDILDTENAIIYALSIGLSKDPKLTEDLKYTYELHDDFSVIPTYGCCIPKSGGGFEKILDIPGIPEFNAMHILHGEQRTEFFKPLVPDAKYASQGSLVDIVDLGKNALLQVQFTLWEMEDNKKILAVKFTAAIMIRGIGGFGFKGTGKSIQVPKIPKREHDEQWEEKTEKNQAILYRITGDKNPLHVDPQMAAMGGFNQPILHGMNFYGIAAKVVIKKFCNGDEKLLKSIQTRFTGHVFPGESILFKMWREGNQIIFAAYTVERNTNCLKGFAEISQQPKL